VVQNFIDTKKALHKAIQKKFSLLLKYLSLNLKSILFLAHAIYLSAVGVLV